MIIKAYVCPMAPGLIIEAESKCYSLPYRANMPGLEHILESIVDDFVSGNAHYYAPSSGTKVCRHCEQIAVWESQ